jgi:hypothetical protein
MIYLFLFFWAKLPPTSVCEKTPVLLCSNIAKNWYKNRNFRIFKHATHHRYFPSPHAYFKFKRTPEIARLSVYVGDLHGTQPITLRTAVYETRTYGGVRGALRQFLAEPSTRLAVRCFFVIINFSFISH